MFPASVTIPETFVTDPQPIVPLTMKLFAKVLPPFVARSAPPVMVTRPVPKAELLLTFTTPDKIAVPPL